MGMVWERYRKGIGKVWEWEWECLGNDILLILKNEI
jgi:hypothetical protein